MWCPYCHKKAVEVSRDEHMNGADYGGVAIEIVYKCNHCGKESMMRLEFEGWYDENDCPMYEEDFK